MTGDDTTTDVDDNTTAETDGDAPKQPVHSKRSNIGSRIFILVAVMVVVFGVVLSSRFGTNPNLIDSPIIGTRMPEVTLPLMEAEGEVVLDDQQGDILVINFWASWCLPCRSENPALISAAAAFDDVDVRFIGVLSQDSPGNGTAFLDELGRGEPYTYAWDDRSRAALAFGTLGLPETFFVSREGVIVAKVTGPINEPLLVNTINELLLGRTVGVIKTGEVENRP